MSFVVGPYAQVPVAFHKVQVEVNKCKFPDDCPKSKENFCPKCGIKNKDTVLKSSIEPIVVFPPKDNEELHDLIFESFVVSNNYPHSISLLNVKKSFFDYYAPYKCDYSFDTEIESQQEQLLDLTNLNIQAALEWFKLDYKRQLDILKSYYPEMKLLYGVLPLYNY